MLIRKIVKVKKKTVSTIAVTKMKIAVNKIQSLKKIAMGKIVNTVGKSVWV